MGNGIQVVCSAALSVALAGSLFTLAGCTGGLGEGGGQNSFASQASFAEDDVDHLLLRAEFGISATARDRIGAVGVAAYVDEMLDFPAAGTTAVEATAEQFLVNAGDPAGLEGKFPSTNDITEWWLYLMLHSEQPFQERLALFWHDHFAISFSVLRSDERYMMVDYINKLRRLGIGNFKTLVLEIARDPAMLE